MKAKHFTKLRKKLKYFYVVQSRGLFGDFYWFKLTHGDIVLAKTAEQAAARWCKRNHEHNMSNETTKQWGKVRVVPHNTPYKRFVKYYS